MSQLRNKILYKGTKLCTTQSLFYEGTMFFIKFYHNGTKDVVHDCINKGSKYFIVFFFMEILHFLCHWKINVDLVFFSTRLYNLVLDYFAYIPLLTFVICPQLIYFVHLVLSKWQYLWVDLKWTIQLENKTKRQNWILFSRTPVQQEYRHVSVG